jgi:hypothetical protein
MGKSLFGFMSVKEGSVESFQKLNLFTGPLGGQGMDRLYLDKTVM